LKVSERGVLDRRTFIKGMLAAGATVTVASCAPVSQAAPVTQPTVTGPAWINPKSLVRPMPGYGGEYLTWKVGDTVKWLPPEKFPADAAADTLAKLSKDQLSEMYFLMNRIRVWFNTWRDIALTKPEPTMYRAIFPRAGQEAVPVGVSANLNNTDYVATTHAGDQDLLAKGVDLKAFAAEALYRVTGCAHGYGGVMHMSAPSVGIVASEGIVGHSTHMAAGAAWAAMVKNTGQVAVAYTGDGAMASRHLFNAMRSAANYKMPLIVVLENNFFSSGGVAAMLSPSPYMADYTTGLGFPTVVVDGENVAQVYAEAKDAVQMARAGDGPSFIECLTYRWYDHSGWGGAKAGVDGAFGLPYRTDDELRAWIARDPIVRYGAFLLDRSLFTQAELDPLKAKAQADMDDALTFARGSPEPKPEDGVKNVYPTGVVPATQFYGHPVIT
jgi:TPP-dependent pyruvate/acetoin dehydrogenase alpha subunit